MKISKLINRIAISKRNVFLSILFLYLGSLLLTIPFINILVTDSFWLCALTCMGFALALSILVMFIVYIFCEIQPHIEDLKYKELFTKTGMVVGVEFAVFALVSFLLLLFPPIFVALGTIVLVGFCILNIFIMYEDLKDRAKDKQSLFKFVKIFHISLITILVVVWLIC